MKKVKNISFSNVEIVRPMTDEVYFSHPAVSNSKLGLLNPAQGGSISKYFEGFDEAKNSIALDLGSAVHQLCLESDKYFLSEVDKPSGKISILVDDIYKMRKAEKPLSIRECIITACKSNLYYAHNVTDNIIRKVLREGFEYYNYLKNYKKKGAISLSPDVKQRVLKCVESVEQNKIAQNLLNAKNSFNEDVIFSDITIEYDDEFIDPITIKLKAKLDNWSIDFEKKIIRLNDVKTTGKPVGNFQGVIAPEPIYDSKQDNLSFKKQYDKGSFLTYHYHRQMAMYGMLLWNYCKSEYGVDNTWKLEVNMIVVETFGNHLSQVFTVGNTMMTAGKEEFYYLICLLAEHINKPLSPHQAFLNEIIEL